MADQALSLQFGQRRQRCLDRPFGRVRDVEHRAQVDDVQHVQPQIAQVVVHRRSAPPGEKAGFHEASSPRTRRSW
jgi:hypothetical protein